MSGSDDKTVNLWDVQTGGTIKTFHGHTSFVCSVSISMDNTIIASGSWDKTICLWDIQTGECCHIIDEFSGYTTSVTFSPTNPQLLISRSSDYTIQQWDTNGHQIGPAYKGTGVVFSPDGTCFVLWDRGIASIQNSDSGVIITTIHAPNSDFQYCCFSPNGKFIAGASGSTAYVWDITGSRPCLAETYAGHTDAITSLTFSSSLISLSNDKSIKFWQIGAPSINSVATDSEYTPYTQASIVSIKLQANDGVTITCDMDGVVRTWDTLTGLCKASFSTSFWSNSQGDMKVVDNRLIIALVDRNIDFSYSIMKKTILIWDTKEGKHIKKVDILNNSPAMCPRMSGDGSKVFHLDESSIQALSTLTGKVVASVVFEGEPLNVPLIVDGSRVWVQRRGLPLQGWDFGTLSSTPTPLSDMPPNTTRSCLGFINGNEGETTGLSRIKDSVTGEEVYHLPERYWGFTTAEWDGQYLVTGYKSGEVLILDFKYMMALSKPVV